MKLLMVNNNSNRERFFSGFLLFLNKMQSSITVVIDVASFSVNPLINQLISADIVYYLQGGLDILSITNGV